MKDNFNKAYKELYISLKHIDEELYNLIPAKLFNMIMLNMDDSYYFYYDSNKKFYEQDFLDETKNLIGYIYYNYWADENEREEFKKAVISNSK